MHPLSNHDTEEQAERGRREQAAAEDLQQQADELDPDVDVSDEATDEELAEQKASERA